MKPRLIIATLALCAAFGLGTLASRAQDTPAPQADFDPQAAMVAVQQKIEATKPRIEPLKAMAGKWEMNQKSYYGGPGAPPTEQKATETATMLGDFWLLGEVEAEMMGQPFHGRSIAGYDMVKDTYVLYWVDTMVPYGMFFEGAYDEATKTFTWVCPMKDAFTGIETVYTIVDREQEDGTHAWEMKSRSAMGEIKLMESVNKRIG